MKVPSLGAKAEIIWDIGAQNKQSCNICKYFRQTHFEHEDLTDSENFTVFINFNSWIHGLS